MTRTKGPLKNLEEEAIKSLYSAYITKGSGIEVAPQLLKLKTTYIHVEQFNTLYPLSDDIVILIQGVAHDG